MVINSNILAKKLGRESSHLAQYIQLKLKANLKASTYTKTAIIYKTHEKLQGQEHGSPYVIVSYIYQQKENNTRKTNELVS